MNDAFPRGRDVSLRIVERLRAVGFDVASIAGPLSGISDAEVLKLAQAGGRILITEDTDFGELVVRQRLGIHGVVLLELERLAKAKEPDRVAEVIAAHADRLANNLVVIEPARVRVRPLSPVPT
jgi:predicted nuclease of predicted toxin-antitoxin system